MLGSRSRRRLPVCRARSSAPLREERGRRPAAAAESRRSGGAARPKGGTGLSRGPGAVRAASEPARPSPKGRHPGLANGSPGWPPAPRLEAHAAGAPAVRSPARPPGLRFLPLPSLPLPRFPSLRDIGLCPALGPPGHAEREGHGEV